MIVGGGPAGLCLANVLREAHPTLHWILLEEGGPPSTRERDNPQTLTKGVGGAGLYSDGKFSFYPSATALWSLSDTPRLQRAYAWVASLLSRFALSPPPFPTQEERLAQPTKDVLKKYPSLQLDLQKRQALIEHLYQSISPNVRPGARLRALTKSGDALSLEIEQGGIVTSLTTPKLFYAGGRLSPLQLTQFIPSRFQRWELGLRLEGASAHPLFLALQESRLRDPKLLFHLGAHEYRTFCFCREGELVSTSDSGLHAVSGRADGAPTGRSNIGFQLRLRQQALFDIERLRGKPIMQAPLLVALEGPSLLEDLYGEEIAASLRRGVERLFSLLSVKQLEGLTAYGPAIEGVGEYPLLDRSLRVEGWPLYVAGDACGLFRGLVAAMVSGAYLGFGV